MRYSRDYYNWQKDIGELGGLLNLFKFREHIKRDDILIDFGSGGGYLLENIDCKEKIGIEINDVARKDALKRGINSVKLIEDIKDSYADIVISSHVLEHIENPLEVLKTLRKKLKKGGKIIFVTPFDNSMKVYKINDINNHLYTWNKQNLGNLFKEAGYRNIKIKIIRSKWPPYYQYMYKIFGLKVFLFISYIYAIIKNNYQIKIVAEK